MDYRAFGAGVLIQSGGKRLRAPGPEPLVEVPDIQFEVFMSIIQIRCAGYSEIKSKHLTKICMWAKKYFSKSFFLSFWAISVGVFFGGNNLFHRFGQKSAPPFPAADSEAPAERQDELLGYEVQVAGGSEIKNQTGR